MTGLTPTEPTDDDFEPIDPSREELGAEGRIVRGLRLRSARLKLVGRRRIDPRDMDQISN